MVGYFSFNPNAQRDNHGRRRCGDYHNRGDVVMVKKSGIGFSTGKGRKTTRRGLFFHMTKSQKLDSLNRVVGVWELESEEDGNWYVKIWEWK